MQGHVGQDCRYTPHTGEQLGVSTEELPLHPQRTVERAADRSQAIRKRYYYLRYDRQFT